MTDDAGRAAPGRWWREPVLHFALIGAALFALDAAVTGRDATSEGPAPTDDAATAGDRRLASEGERRLVIGAEIRAELVERWRATHDREPTPAEIEAEIQRWRDDEILYREGLRLGIDRGDPVVRERIASKMAKAVGARVIVPEPADEELRAWFERNGERWARPELVDFTQVYVTGSDDAARARAEAILAQLGEGADPARLGDTFQGGRRYRRRKLDDLAGTFGDPFVAVVRALAPDRWQLAPSRFGWHVVRVDRRTAAAAPSFDEVRADVRKDWQDERRRALQEEAMAELRQRWTVVTP